MRRPAAAAALVLGMLFVAGCRGPGLTRTPPSPATTPGPRVGLVDIERLARGHPRWSELDDLNKKMAAAEARLAAPTGLLPVVQQRLERQLRAQAATLRAEFEREMQALKQREQANLARFAAQVRAEQSAKLDRLRAAIGEEMRKALEDRVRAARLELRQYEAQVMEEYRFPIANLRLKADVVGVETEEELRRITEELDRLLTERDAKVRARAEVVDVALRDFQKAKEAEATARLERTSRELAAESSQRLAVRERTLRAEIERLANGKQRAFQARLNAFRRRLLAVAQNQLAAAQGRYAQGLRQQEQQLLAERQALQEQRARLEETILADVKIEIAAIAAAQGFDVVLTRYLANVTGEDMTTAVLARMKR